jgi:flagellin-specific chaperone FliS
MNRLIEANVQQDPARVEEVLKVLAPLRDAWREVITKQSPHPKEAVAL